jgi:hypothetical protein
LASRTNGAAMPHAAALGASVDGFASLAMTVCG